VSPPLLLDQAIENGRLDVAADYGFLLPVYVLAEFMGVPAADHDRVVQWSVDFVDFFNVIPITPDTAQRMVRSSDEMARFMRDLLSARTTHERDDFLGLMARAARTEGLSEQEAIGSTMLLLIAGHLPVRNLIGNVVWLLGRHPDDHERVRAARDMIDGVIEETLRYEPPIAAIPRITMEDIAVCGPADSGRRGDPALDPRRQP
jgi:cytochrome P450